MKRSFLIVGALVFLTACGARTGSSVTPAVPQTYNSARDISTAPVAGGALELANLDYGSGAITVYRVTNGKAAVVSSFRPSPSGAQGLAIDRRGYIYTTVTASNSKPCSACIEVFRQNGSVVARVDAPILKGAANPPFLTSLSLDSQGNMYVSDYGQQAVYVFARVGETRKSPFIIVQNSSNAASVLSTPNGGNVFVSGGCGFASVRPYTRSTSVPLPNYQPGNCFGIGTIALIGAAADNDEDILTPVDGVPGLVSVSSPSGGNIFMTPGGFRASISGVSMPSNGRVAYVADHQHESVYVFARPLNGWLQGGQPKLLATYTGFKNLDIITVQP